MGRLTSGSASIEFFERSGHLEAKVRTADGLVRPVTIAFDGNVTVDGRLIPPLVQDAGAYNVVRHGKDS
ncbi:MAG: hypothetical protein Q7S03_03105 [bacterium]|nr:hypothetical protein [bacterium]